MYIFVVSTREWHSLEMAFRTKDEALEWTIERGAHQYDITPVEMFANDQAEEDFDGKI
jgi:hypothetical protein